MKKNLFLSVTALLTLCLVGCANSTSSKSIEQETPIETIKQEKGLVINEVNGVEVSADNSNPKAGERVTLNVKNQNLKEKRVDAVKLNGTLLNGIQSSFKDTTTYEFIMPSNEIAIIDIVAVDVFEVKVHEEVASKFSIYGIEDGVAAQGEVVEFRPATYAGYFFNGVSAIENDVVITQSETKGWYQFTMPNHAVTLTSEINKNIYKVSFNSNKTTEKVTESGVEVEKEVELWTLSGISANTYHEFGEEIKFKVYDQTVSRYKITSVKLEGQEMTLDSDNYYSFAMPAYDVNVEVTADYYFRKLIVDNTATNFDVVFKTVFENEEVAVTDNNVIKGSEIRAYVTLHNDADAHSCPKFSFTAGNEESSLSAKTINVNYDADLGCYKFEMPGNDFVKVSIADGYQVLATDPIYGSYEGGYQPYNIGNAIADLGSNFKRSSTYSTSLSDKGALQFITNGDFSHMSIAYSAYTTYDLYFDGVDTILYNEGNSSLGASTLFSKGHGSSVVNECYSYVNKIGSTLQTQFINAKFNDGTTKTCFINYTTKTVYFGVEAIVTKGNATTVTKDNEIEILNGNELLACYKVTTLSTAYSGYQHTVGVISLDEYRGTYTKNESVSLYIDGHGTAKLGDESYPYTIEDGKILINGNYYIVDKENFTYEQSTDGLDGTYTSETGNLVLDGYGNATYLESSATYEKVSTNTVKVVVGSETYYFDLNVTSRTFKNAKFIIDNSATYTFTLNDEGNLVSNNQQINSSSAILKITALQDITVTFKYNVSSENKYDGLVIKKDSDTLLTKANGSGTIADTEFSVTLSAGEVLSIEYQKDSSGNSGTDTAIIKELKVDTELVY